MRPRDKIEKYIIAVAEKQTDGQFELIESARSRYFKFNDNVLRVSDHIGANSSGAMSIIIPNRRDSQETYIVHAHTSGSIVMFTYEELKEFVRTFFRLSSMFTELTSFNIESFNKDKREISILKREVDKWKSMYENLKSAYEATSDEDNKLFGYDLEEYTQNQLRSLKNMADSFFKDKK